MMKRITALLLAAVFTLSLCACGSEKDTSTEAPTETSNGRYQYENLDEYIVLGDYKNIALTLEQKVLDYEFNSARLEAATRRKFKDGDKLVVTVCAYILPDGTSADKVDTSKLTAVPSQSFEAKEIILGNNGDCLLELEALMTEIKVGEIKTTTKTFEPDYSDSEAAGKTLYFTVELVSAPETLVAVGDSLNASYTGYYLDENGDILKDDKGNDKSFNSSLGADFLVGSGLAIKDFEAAFVGMYVGETKIFEATFPDDYKADTEIPLAGSTVKFKVTVLSVSDTPELNDAFVKESFGYDTKEKATAAILEYYKSEMVVDRLLEISTFKKYPEKEYADVVARVAEEKKEFEKQYGTYVTFEQYLAYYESMTYDQYVEDSAKKDLIYYAIGKAENIVITEEKCISHFYDTFYEYAISQGSTEAEAKSSAESAVATVRTDKAQYLVQTAYDNAMYDEAQEFLEKHSTISVEK